eukprot:scaffold4124_cov267-Chaetoceros_neogracile.AAC.43
MSVYGAVLLGYKATKLMRSKGRKKIAKEEIVQTSLRYKFKVQSAGQTGISREIQDPGGSRAS